MIWLLLLSCTGPEPDPEPAFGVEAIVDSSRAEHFFDAPFPSDAYLNDAFQPELDGFPVAPGELFAQVVDGWTRRLEITANGFANNGAIYFRFAGPLIVDETFSTAGEPTDSVVLVALDGSEQLPIDARFVADPKGDPFYGENTLAIAPALGHPPVSGGTYAAVVLDGAGARAPADYTLPDGVQEALDALNIGGTPAVATVFTVQDATGQLRQLVADVDSRVGDFGAVTYKRVVELDYAQGKTQSGKDATVATAHFEDGTSRAAYLSPGEVYDQTIDLVDWPMVVYEAEIPIFNYQGLDDRPYMRPSLGHALDIDTFTGWIDFEGGQLVSEPESEMMRITVSIPKDDNGDPIDSAPVILYDHGTAGHAYNAVQRRHPDDRNDVHAQLYAEAGFAVIGRDATLYGTRYPLIDEGHGGSLGFYNIVNLPAFRDNQRQTAVDGYTLLRYVEEQINDDLPAGSIDATQVRKLGHSLGSVTTNLGLAAAPESYDAALLSGTGGVFSLYFLETGLLGTIGDDTIRSLFPLFGVEAPEELDINSIFGAALGIPEPAWSHLDRLHPTMMVFQWTMDPSDAMAIARDEEVPTLIYMGIDDYQVPNLTTEALDVAQPQSTFQDCTATADYDPHQCLWREEEGFDALEDWLGTDF